MIKAIFFDLDDTLIWDRRSVDLAFTATCKVAEERYGVDPVKLEENVRKAARKLFSSYATFPFTKMIGISPFEGLWGEFSEEGEHFRALRKLAPTYRKDAWTIGLQTVGIHNPEFGYELSVRFPKERRKNPVVFEETFPLLEALKNKYRLLLLTNGSPSLQKTKLELTSQLGPYFEHIVISGDYGKGKPDKRIFEYALSLMSLEEEEVIMVGDNLNTDILGANSAGILSVWLNRNQKQRNEVVPSFEIQTLGQLEYILVELNR